MPQAKNKKCFRGRTASRTTIGGYMFLVKKEWDRWHYLCRVGRSRRTKEEEREYMRFVVHSDGHGYMPAEGNCELTDKLLGR